MLANGISPLDAAPPLDLDDDRLRNWRLWTRPRSCGSVCSTVIAAPIGRVIVSGINYGRADDRLMVAVSIGILLVIAVGVGTALTVSV